MSLISLISLEQVNTLEQVTNVATVSIAFLQFILLFLLFRLNSKQNRFIKLSPILTGHADLSNSRSDFWQELNRSLHELHGFPDSLDLLLFDQTGESLRPRDDLFPNPDPAKQPDLFAYVQKYSPQWEQQHLPIWLFAKEVSRPATSLNSARRQLAYFWDRAAKLLDIKTIRSQIFPDWKELVFLTWLELALVQKTLDLGRPGKVDLFELTKAHLQFIKQQFNEMQENTNAP